MHGNRLFPPSRAVGFFAMDVTDSSAAVPRAGNDNNCPHCGGVLGPGDRAQDCSGSMALPSKSLSAKNGPKRPVPKGSEAWR